MRGYLYPTNTVLVDPVAQSLITTGKWKIFFKGVDTTYLISRYIPHSYDPTVLGVVANEKDVYIAGVADQQIVDGNKFTGSTYPSRLPGKVIDTLKEYTRKIGRFMGSLGYRGIFGCDFIVDDDFNIFFL